MKLQDLTPNFEVANQLGEKLFSIGDTSMIFDILRSKMYSNPILAITREICSNASDAHREVGTPDLPIHVYLPNEIEPYYKVKDFGPGISPDRMENIYIKYGVSSKREDNTQKGGFGLGAKTPFAYTDSFSIITIYNGVQYNYNCFIDESKVGKLYLASETSTTASNGTEIKIPVRRRDFSSFQDYTEQSCRHWKIKPIIKGGKINWSVPQILLEGNGWRVARPEGYYKKTAAIIDGIEYPIDLSVLKESTIRDAMMGCLFIDFENGELTLSANREQIYLDEPTQQKVKQKLHQVIEEIKALVLKQTQTCSNLWDANVCLNKALSTIFDINYIPFGSIHWNNLPLWFGKIDTQVRVFSFSKKTGYKRGANSIRLSRRVYHSICPSEKSELYVNNLPLQEITTRHVKKAFEQNPELVSLQVVCPSDKYDLDFLNQTIHLDQMLPKLLSSLTKATGRTHKKPSSKMLVFRFDEKLVSFHQVSYASIKEDKNKKVLCFLNRNYGNCSQQIMVGEHNLGCLYLKKITETYSDHSFYGVYYDLPQSRINESFAKFLRLEDFIQNTVFHNGANHFLMVKAFSTQSTDTDQKFLKDYAKIKKAIKDPQSLFLSRLDYHKRIVNIKDSDLHLLSLYEIINGRFSDQDVEQFLDQHPQLNVDQIEDQYKKTYPLLQEIDYYYYQGEKTLPAILDYVNLVDQR